jgi:outer membrane receptor for ferrienterochelin and colicins
MTANRTNFVTPTLAALLALLLIHTAASAQSATSAPPPAPAVPQRVEVTGTASGDDRKDANTAKSVVTREDIARFGDTSMGQVLARVPGVTVTGSGTQAREITLRGLGGGYTQILVNGEPVPPGFSLDSLSPDLIERIEMIRAGTADSSAQGIAGSINIILRRTARAGQHELKVTGSVASGLGSGSISSQYSDQLGAATSYSIGTSLNHELDRVPSSVDFRVTTGDGTLTLRQPSTSMEHVKKTTVGVAPRLTHKPSDTQTLTLEGLLQWQHLDYRSDETRRAVLGPPPTFDHNQARIVTDTLQSRLSLQWKAPFSAGFGEDARIDIKASLNDWRRRFDGTFQGDLGGVQQVDRTVGSDLSDTSGSLVGKATIGLGDAHTLGTGWDLQTGRRREDRIQRETSSTSYPVQNIDEDYSVRVHRVAAYVQDEWAISDRLSNYLGLRWEGLQTRTQGVVTGPVGNTASVLSPTWQLLWKLPDTKADQLRLSLGRTYKAPTARDLLPRRWVVADNAATSPNFQGNPALVPELAWGLDLGYERYLAGDSFLGMNVYARQISNVILQRVFQDSSGTWIATPVNSGSALVAGAALEGKAKLKALWPASLLAGSALPPDLPNVDLRIGLGYNASRVAAVPGPNNRLSKQPPWTGSVGADYRAADVPLTLGVSFSGDAQQRVRVSSQETLRLANKRQWDVYSAWKLGPSSTLRATWANLGRTDAGQLQTYDSATGLQSRDLTITTFRVFRLSLELKL